MGLWVRAGSWCAQQLTDGFIPREMVPVLGGRPRDAEALVANRLWVDVDGGYVFHEWNVDGRQPTRSDVEKTRGEWRERQRKARAAARNGTHS